MKPSYANKKVNNKLVAMAQSYLSFSFSIEALMTGQMKLAGTFQRK